jgi:hypothetical protein
MLNMIWLSGSGRGSRGEKRLFLFIPAVTSRYLFTFSFLHFTEGCSYLIPLLSCRIPVRLVFESALELMSYTQVGSFNMKQGPGGEKKGPPPAVKKVRQKQ